MKYLLKNCKIIDPSSPHHGESKDVLIVDGIIKEIGFDIPSDDCEVIESDALHVSQGWIDIGAELSDPGHEERETIETLCAAARAGGYTDIAVFPTSRPVIQNKSDVKNLIHSGKSNGITIHPIGALSVDLKGENITEYIDLHTAGAIAFADGNKSIQKSGLIMRALQYVKTFDGLIIHHPSDHSLDNGNHINEGASSIQMGMKGAPNIAETIMLTRDLELNAYSESKLAIHNISTAESIDIITQAKNDQSTTFVGIPFINLVKTEEDILGFESNLKVNPPLRHPSDKKALIDAVNTGKIDYISSNHRPLEEEVKKLEFGFAAHGMIGLQTAFAALNGGGEIPLENIVKCLTDGPRKVLGLDNHSIETGQKARLTIFDPTKKWTYNIESKKSLSENSPYLGQEMTGLVIKTIS